MLWCKGVQGAQKNERTVWVRSGLCGVCDSCGAVAVLKGHLGSFHCRMVKIYACGCKGRYLVI